MITAPPSEEAASPDRWFSVSLRIFGDYLDLDAVEQRLGLSPSRMGRKGDHIQGNQRLGLYRTNLWSWNSNGPRDEPWEPKLVRLLDAIEPHSDWLAELRASGVSMDIFLGYCSDTGQGGATITSPVLERLGRLGITLDLDLYPPHSDLS